MQCAYDDFGQLVTEYQEHGGAVNTSTSLKVGYSYANGSSNTIRLTKMTYPDGRELNYSYGSSGSTDDALSRVASLIDNDGTTHLVDYSYLGAGSFIRTDYADIDVRCDLAHGTGSDPYDGPIDRFGRVTDLLWYDYGSSADVLRIKHGHDRAGNRLNREEADTSDLDQLYSYDDVNRLAQSAEGTLSGTKDSVSSLNFAQQWSLDATGNWSGFKEDDDGDATWDLDQSRTSNKVNKITDVTETAGPTWLTPAYNRAGNMTTIPQPGDPTQSYTASYDAWNRLVKLEDGQNTVAEYVFDGAKRLVVRKKYVSGSLNQTRHFYHTAQWQTIEERLESSGQIAATADRQFTWGLRYIDDLVCRTANSLHDYAYQDANWNVVLSSSALARVVYQPYGQIRSTCAAAQGDLDAWEHYFAGYRRDEDTGLYLVRHRVYQPELGCWVQRDPIGYGAGDVNLCRYAVNGPHALLDAIGLAAFEYEPGLGSFTSVFLSRSASNHGIRSLFGAEWTPNTAAFFDNTASGKKCKRCNSIGFAQVVKQTTDFSGASGWFWRLLYNMDWHVDAWIPYPDPMLRHMRSSGDPTVEPFVISIGDHPGLLDKRHVGATLELFRQEFETCVVCLDGLEGIQFDESQLGEEPYTRRLRSLTVYGCVNWMHSLRRRGDGSYAERRGVEDHWAQPDPMAGRDSHDVNMALPFPGVKQSARFERAVEEEYLKAVSMGP